ncbi:MAG: diaminohydroxyphosphoribosylaminopyrimidine deaminase [Paracoccaceae bacterium]|jgi:diaminohydroxyphosphoribosylaminopyrimidine deaminase/5-amino-6-(5-phosphoribosylamino)uracil reductase
MVLLPGDTRWMKLALSLGRRGQGRTWPNPSVGCVIVKENQVMGRGWTQAGGRPHGETQALSQAGHHARGATAYVTLEPCAHIGKTPPCAEALIAAGIVRVVTAATDPDSRVAGRGHEILRRAGITVDTGCLAAEATLDHAGFFNRINLGRPYVTLKLAASFDGRIATKSGESQWITGAGARRLVHLERATHDAVMIGSGTAIADDPTLNVRDLGVTHQPIRLVCDTALKTDPGGKLGQSARDIPLWICHGPKVTGSGWAGTDAKLIPCETDETGRLEMTDVLNKLAKAGLTRIFCEGGGQLAASLLAADYVDRLVGFTAGLTLGADAIPAIAALPDGALADQPRFVLDRVQKIGPDALHVWHRR